MKRAELVAEVTRAKMHLKNLQDVEAGRLTTWNIEPLPFATIKETEAYIKGLNFSLRR